MFESVLNLLIPVANIIEKDVPGFAQKTQIQINQIRTEYVQELGKAPDLIDDAKLYSLECQLRDLVELCYSSIQPANTQAKP